MTKTTPWSGPLRGCPQLSWCDVASAFGFSGMQCQEGKTCTVSEVGGALYFTESAFWLGIIDYGYDSHSCVSSVLVSAELSGNDPQNL